MEAQVFKGRHSITASCSQQSDSDTESEEEIKPTRKVFQAKVQKLLAVRWFTQKRGVRYRHLRRSGCCTDVAPTPEEEALLGKVLSSRHLMHKTTEMLQSFQREISGVDGFFDELGVQPSWVGRLEDSLFADDKKESLMKLAVKAIHQAKWMSLRICYNDHMKQQEQELKVLKQNYEKLRQQFAEVRQDYLQEVATLRDQVRIRGDVETEGWMDESGGDVVYFFDPAKALTPKETHFVLHAVKEKLMMILEQNPRIGGAGGPVDLGQLEKLKDLKENKELEDLRSELVKRSHELIEAQRALRKLQEEMIDAIFQWMTSLGCIDTSKVFAGGFSYGGTIVQDLACVRSWQFRGLAPDVAPGDYTDRGLLHLGDCKNATPVTYISFCGTGDISHCYLNSIAKAETVAKQTHCSRSELRRKSATVNCTVWSGCHAGHIVESCMVYRMDHEIPGRVAPDGTSFLHPGSDLDYTKYVFEKFSLQVASDQLRFYGHPTRAEEDWKQEVWPPNKMYDSMYLRTALATQGLQTLPNQRVSITSTIEYEG